jgi:hypothetical protein
MADLVVRSVDVVVAPSASDAKATSTVLAKPGLSLAAKFGIFAAVGAVCLVVGLGAGLGV